MSAAGIGFVRKAAGGVRLHVRVTANARADTISGLHEDAGGTNRLAVKVRAAPDKGAANAAVTALVAKALKVPKSAVAVASGATARQKTLLVEGEPRELSRRVQDLVTT
jgi:hypothetical protein